MKFMILVSDTLYKFEKLLSVILMSVMLGSIALGVVFRYIVGSPLTWTDELAVYMLIWLTFVGGSMSLKTGRAASLDLVFDRMNLLWKRIFLVVGYLSLVVFAMIIAYVAIQWISNPSVKTSLSPGLKISMFMPYMAVPFGILCLLVHAINHLIQAFTYREIEVVELKGGDE